MRHWILSLGLVVGAWTIGAPPAVATGPSAETRRTSSFEPCRWWRYDTQSGTYTCSSKDWRITVYQSREVDQLIGGLQRKIDALENRVKVLEQGR